jgi:hypothetical protein
MRAALTVFGQEELTKPRTWSALPDRSTTSDPPRFATRARIGMSVAPWPSSSSVACPS